MDLEVQNREKFGKANKALRGEGLIPAEIYGGGTENLHVSVNAKEFLRVFKKAGESTIVYLLIDGTKQPVLIQDIQKDGVSQEITHVDFYRVRMDEEITASVPLKFVGESPAVKERLGTLNKALLEVEVKTLPGDLPHEIEVDLSALVDLEKSIQVKDLKISEKVKILDDPEAVVATVVELREEETQEKPMDVSDVKVEGEEKKEEKPDKSEGDKGDKKEEAK